MCRDSEVRAVKITAVVLAPMLMLNVAPSAAGSDVYSCHLTRAASGQVAKNVVPVAHMTFTVTADPAAVTSTRGDHYRDLVITSNAIHFADHYGARYRIDRKAGVLRIMPRGSTASFIEGRCKLDIGKHN